MDNAVKRINKSCAHYPCHKSLNDCTFCFCPLYPCQDTSRGRQVFSKKQNKTVWSCRGCSWIHQKEVVDDIFRTIRNKEVVLKGERYFKKAADTGIIILAHGSRLDSTKGTLRRVIKVLKKNIKLKHILPAYLQFSLPTLSGAIEQLVLSDCRRVIIAPYFLFNGNHVTRDIPLLIQKEKEKFSGVELICTRALAESEQRMSDIVTQRIREVI